VNSRVHTAVPEQPIVGLLVQKVERSHHDISGQMLVIPADADAFHSGRTRGFDAVRGIFYDDAMLGCDT